jgi:NAD(P)-dependent dehydrogenase (short-subunit alcohol dehydrogenase family)
MSVETVLVTGASSGIGRELAKCFGADGCRLVLFARSGGPLDVLAGDRHYSHRPLPWANGDEFKTGGKCADFPPFQLQRDDG